MRFIFLLSNYFISNLLKILINSMFGIDFITYVSTQGLTINNATKIIS